MPLSFRIDSDAGTLMIVGEGFITQPERIEAIQAWLRDPGFRPGLKTLCDFSASTSTPTMRELREIVALVDEHAAAIGKKRLAVVATKPVTFGMARQFQRLADFGPLDVEVFKDRRTALGWLHHGEPQP
jgi:hypothetical protein